MSPNFKVNKIGLMMVLTFGVFVGVSDLLALPFPSSQSKNLLGHSSFETPGDNHWGYGGSKFDEGDFSSDAVHGQYSLRWPYKHPAVDWPYQNPHTKRQYSNLYYHAVKANPGETYTLSFYAKYDSASIFPGGVTLKIITADRNAKDILQNPYFEKRFDFSTDWKRYHASFVLPPSLDNEYVVVFVFPGEAGDQSPYPATPRISGLIDAVQLERGGLTTFQPKYEVEMGVFPLADANAFEWGDPILIDVYASNTLSESVVDTLQVHVEDFFNETVVVQALALNISAQERVKQTLSLDSSLRGHFRILIKKGSEVLSEKIFSTLPPAKDFPAAESVFGTDSSLLDFVTTLAKRLGFKWLRPHADLAWEFIEPKQKGSFTFPDLLVNQTRQKGLELFGLLYRVPAWARPNGAQDPHKVIPRNWQDWSDYVSQVVSHFGPDGGIKYWEILNEPAHVFSGDDYLTFVEKTHTSAKAVDPTAQLMGWSGQAKTYSSHRADILPYLDLLSGHYYTTYFNTGSTGVYDGLIHHKDVVGNNQWELWNTEGGTLGGPTFYKTKSDYDPYDSRWVDATNALKFWAQHKAANVKAFYYWLNFPSSDIDHFPAYTKSWTLNEYDSSLKAGAVGTAVAAHFLDGKDIKFEKVIYNGSGENKLATVFHFSAPNNQSILTAWANSSSKQIQIKTESLTSVARIYDMFGRQRDVVQGGAQLDVLLSDSPIYIVLDGINPSSVNENLIVTGEIFDKQSIIIKETVSEESSAASLFVQIFGSENSEPAETELLFQDTVSNPSEVIYGWDAPVTNPDPSTLLLYHFDKRQEFGESPALVHDFSGKDRDGVLSLQGGVSWAASEGKFGGGLVGTGESTPGPIVRVPHNASDRSFDGLKEFTVMMWVKFNGTNALRLFSKGDVMAHGLGPTPVPPFLGRIRESGSEIIFQVSDGTIYQNRWSNVGFPHNDGLYHHLTFVYDAKSPQQELRKMDIYLDGEPVNGVLAGSGGGCGERPTGPVPGCPIPDQTNPFNSDDIHILGLLGQGQQNQLNGAFDEFVFLNRALSQEEITNQIRLSPQKTYHWFIKVTGNGEVIHHPKSGSPGDGGFPPPVSTKGPLRFAGSPVGVQLVGTAPLLMKLMTDTVATCRFGESGNQNYFDLPFSFDQTGSIDHSVTLTNLVRGTSYRYFIRCLDSDGAANDADYVISFEIASGSAADDNYGSQFENKFGKFNNVFNPSKSEEVAIRFTLRNAVHIDLSVYNSRGKHVKELISKDFNSRTHDLKWNGRNENGDIMASGVYLLVLKIGDSIETKKVVVVK